MRAIARFRIDDTVRVDAPVGSIDAKFNGQTGRIVGFVEDWFVIINIKGTEYRFRPDVLRISSRA